MLRRYIVTIREEGDDDSDAMIAAGDRISNSAVALSVARLMGGTLHDTHFETRPEVIDPNDREHIIIVTVRS